MAAQAGQNDDCKCPICDRVCISPRSKEDHLLRSDCGLTCKLCRKVFANLNDLKDHWKTAHARCYCSICDKLCVSQQARIYHQQHKHFFCKPCGRMFADMEKWTEHTETYSHYTCCPKCNLYVREFNGELDKHVENCSGPGEDVDGAFSKRKPEKYDVKQPKHQIPRKDYLKGDKKPKPKPKEKEYPDYVPKYQIPKKDYPKGDKKPKPKPKETGLPDDTPDLYGDLRIHPSSTQGEIAQAARKRRIEVHPDKLKKPGMTDKELEKIDQTAMQVGRAADILLDPEKKAKYDKKLTDRSSKWK